MNNCDASHSEPVGISDSAALFLCPFSVPIAIYILGHCDAEAVLEWVGKLDLARLHARSEYLQKWRPGQDGPPPNICWTCCSKGVNRLRLLFVCSPFRRLAAAFQRSPSLNGTNTTVSWKDFGSWLPEILEADPAPLRSLRSTFPELWETSTPADHAEEVRPHVIRSEAVHRDLHIAEHRLCSEIGYCRGLPFFRMGDRMAASNDGKVAVPALSRLFNVTSSLLEAVQQHYHHDFEG